MGSGAGQWPVGHSRPHVLSPEVKTVPTVVPSKNPQKQVELVKDISRESRLINPQIVCTFTLSALPLTQHSSANTHKHIRTHFHTYPQTDTNKRTHTPQCNGCQDKNNVANDLDRET